MSNLAQQIKQSYDSSNNYLKGAADLGYCEQMVNECLAGKSDLIALLSKHPCWDAENYRVHFDADYERQKDIDAAAKHLSKIGDILMDRTDGDLYQLGRMFCYTQGMFCVPIQEDTVEYVRNRLGGDAHIHEGSKPTKAVMKLLRQYGFDDLNDDLKHEILRAYSLYADALSPTIIKRHTVISVNPVDFIRMSDGNSWQSCHKIPDCNVDPVDDEGFGCYAGGCLSYAYDHQTMIMYTVSGEVDNDDLTMAEKTTRQVYFWNGTMLLGSRLYPQDMDGNSIEYQSHRAIAEKVIAECLGVPNVWRKVEEYHTYSEGLHYRDYEYANYPAFEPSLTEHGEYYNNRFEIGEYEGYYTCVVCGTHGIYDHQFPVCGDCIGNGHFYCDCCGCYTDDGPEHYVDGEDVTVCQYHYDEYVEGCQECGTEYYTDCDHMTRVDSEDAWVCNACLEAYYHQSEYSDEWFRENNMTELEGVGWVANDEVENYAHAEDRDHDLYLLIDDLNEYVDPDTGEVKYYYYSDNIPGEE